MLEKENRTGPDGTARARLVPVKSDPRARVAALFLLALMSATRPAEAAPPPTGQEKPSLATITDTVLVLDERDLSQIMDERGVEAAKRWNAELVEARRTDRIVRKSLLPSNARLEVSVQDLLDFKGLKSQLAAGTACSAKIPLPEGVDGNQSVIVTGALGRIVHTDRLEELLEEPPAIGCTLRRVWNDFENSFEALGEGASMQAKRYAAMIAKEPDRIMGLVKRIDKDASDPFQIVPHPAPSVLVLYDRIGLVEAADLDRNTGTIRRKNHEDYVVVPESHGLVEHLKQRMLTYFNSVSLFSCADPAKGECSYYVFKRNIFERLKSDCIEQLSKTTLGGSRLGEQSVYIQYKEKDERWLKPDEEARLRALPSEVRERKHAVTVEVLVEYYERAPRCLWRSKAETDGRFVPGVVVRDMVDFKVEPQSLVFPTVKPLALPAFYKDTCAKRLERKLAQAELNKRMIKSLMYNDATQGEEK